MEYQNLPQERSAFLAIVGKPNVGKSSVLNRLIGQKIAIVSKKTADHPYPYYGSAYGRGIPTGIFGYSRSDQTEEPVGGLYGEVSYSVDKWRGRLPVGYGGWRKSIKGR